MQKEIRRDGLGRGHKGGGGEVVGRKRREGEK